MHATQTTKTDSKYATSVRCLFVGSAGGSQQRELIAATADSRCEVEHHSEFDAARERAAEQGFDLVVFDLRDDEVDLATLKADWMPTSSIVVTTDERGRASGLDGVRIGLSNFLCEPFDVESAAATLREAAFARHYRTELARISSTWPDRENGEFLVGRSPVMRRLDSAIRRASEIDATVLIEGATGTGKTTIARGLHAAGRRGNGPLVVVNSAGLTEELLVEALDDATRGTLLIEHIEKMPAKVQSKLVQKLKERSSAAQPDDARIIATTEGRLAELTARGAFREDLYYRLNVFPIQMPLLKERTEDIALLASTFLRAASEMSGMAERGFTPAALVLLETNPWPGNVAQLRNAVFRAHVAAGKKSIDRVHLMGPVVGVQAPPEVAELRGAQDQPEQVRESEILTFQEEEKRILSRALRAAKGNVRRAAELLGIGRATLYRKIQVFELSLS